MATGCPPALTLRNSRAGRALASLTALSLVLTSGAGSFTSLARAADLPRVLVLPYAPIYDALPMATGRKVAHVLEAELRGSEQLQLVSLDPSALGAARTTNPTPKRDPALLAEANERASKAEEHIRKLRFKPAAEELEKVIDLLERQHPFIQFDQLVNAYLDLAVANMRLGQDSEAEDLLAQVVRLDPERVLEPDRFPPVFIRTHQNVGKRLKSAPRATLRVEPNPPGAVVFLDGREVGRGPAVIEGVIRGRHFVRVQPPTGEPWGDKIQATAGATLRLAPELAGGSPVQQIVAALSRNTLDEATLAAVVSLARASKAEYVVLGGVIEEGGAMVVASHLVQVATGRVCLLQRVRFDAEMLSAGIEIYKVGADIGNRIEVFGAPEALPVRVVREALPPGSPARIAAAEDAPLRTPEATPMIVRRTDDGTVAVPAAEARTFASGEPADPGTGEARRLPTRYGEPDPEAIDPIIDHLAARKSRTWLWILLGAAVVGGGAAGGYLYYDAATRPVTGSATMHW